MQVQRGAVRADRAQAGGVPGGGLDEQHVRRLRFGVVGARVQRGDRVEVEGVQQPAPHDHLFFGVGDGRGGVGEHDEAFSVVAGAVGVQADQRRTGGQQPGEDLGGGDHHRPRLGASCGAGGERGGEHCAGGRFCAVAGEGEAGAGQVEQAHLVPGGVEADRGGHGRCGGRCGSSSVGRWRAPSAVDRGEGCRVPVRAAGRCGPGWGRSSRARRRRCRRSREATAAMSAARPRLTQPSEGRLIPRLAVRLRSPATVGCSGLGRRWARLGRCDGRRGGRGAAVALAAGEAGGGGGRWWRRGGRVAWGGVAARLRRSGGGVRCRTARPGPGSCHAGIGRGGRRSDAALVCCRGRAGRGPNRCGSRRGRSGRSRWPAHGLG